MHRSQSLFYLTNFLHVSGDTITQLQEHKTTVTTASGNSYVCIFCCTRFSAPLLYSSLLLFFYCLRVYTRPKPSHFQGEYILSTPSLRGKVKPSVTCRSFTACNRSLNVVCRTAFRQNYRTFLAHSSTFRRWALSRGDTRGDAWFRKLGRLTHIAQ